METVRALVWLGADVIIAEADEQKGLYAEKAVNEELGTDRAHFFKVDLSDETQIDKLHAYIVERFGFLDVIFNNATIAPMGAVEEVDVSLWDKSYAVNLRAPVLLIRRFLPEMKKCREGIIVFVPSSGAAPYMSAYEVFKTAQVELCNTLVGELEDTGIIAYSIGPGLVKTETAMKSIEIVAGRMKMSLEEFYRMNESKMIGVESAGTGFAASVALAERYNGQEIGAIQVLIDAKVYEGNAGEGVPLRLDEKKQDELKKTLVRVIDTYREQYDGWMKRNIFEKQWVLRDFKKTVGMSVDDMNARMDMTADNLSRSDISQLGAFGYELKLLKTYYDRQYKLLQGYEKDPKKLRENSDIITSWIYDIDNVLSLM